MTAEPFVDARAAARFVCDEPGEGAARTDPAVRSRLFAGNTAALKAYGQGVAPLVADRIVALAEAIARRLDKPMTRGFSPEGAER